MVKKRNRISESLSPEEHTRIKAIIDGLPYKGDAKKLLKVNTYNTIDKVYYSGKASPRVIRRVKWVIEKNAA